MRRKRTESGLQALAGLGAVTAQNRPVRGCWCCCRPHGVPRYHRLRCPPAPCACTHGTPHALCDPPRHLRKGKKGLHLYTLHVRAPSAHQVGLVQYEALVEAEMSWFGSLEYPCFCNQFRLAVLHFHTHRSSRLGETRRSTLDTPPMCRWHSLLSGPSYCCKPI